MRTSTATTRYCTPLGGWQAFDNDCKPELDREFHIEDSPDPKSLYVYRMHREGMHLATLQLRMDGGSWKEVDCANTAWLIRNCKWRYAGETAATAAILAKGGTT